MMKLTVDLTDVPDGPEFELVENILLGMTSALTKFKGIVITFSDEDGSESGRTLG